MWRAADEDGGVGADEDEPVDDDAVCRCFGAGSWSASWWTPAAER